MYGYKEIRKRKQRILTKLSIDSTLLDHYRYVDELHELNLGAFIRWVNADQLDKLMNGAFVVRIDIEDDGTRILCKNGKRFLTLYMDECILFQKITPEENILFLANDLSKSN